MAPPKPPPKRNLNSVLLAGAALAKSAPKKNTSGNPKRYKKSIWSTTASHNNIPTPPKYKILPQTSILIDGFKYVHPNTSSTYFLTHFHFDHYGGITSNWSAGTIYCSSITSKLLQQQLNVDAKYIQELPMNEAYTIISKDCKGMDVTVTLTDANHCPGAVIFFFTLKKPTRPKAIKRILHVGDFRWNTPLFLKNSLYIKIKTKPVGWLNELFLDTTYCDEKYCFPEQGEAVKATIECVENEDIKNLSTLFLFGAYTIGKEKVFLEVAKKFKKKIYVDSQRYKILSTFIKSDEFEKIFTRNQNETNMWVVSLGNIVNKGMKEILESANKSKKTLSNPYYRVVGFRPSGWSFNPPKKNTSNKKQTLLNPIKRSIPDIVSHRVSGSISIYGIPYSEHSSFSELVDCLLCLRPVKITPTVGAGRSEEQVDLLLTACRVEAERRMYEE
ncbi:hypothetical protein TrLO_g13792 [Triparma laevis f. longispina]|nr:hypothetical protein TrLO_g13792 [Triparma laevis f. longispina]